MLPLRTKDVGANFRVNLRRSLIAIGVSGQYHHHVAVDLGVQLCKLLVLASGLKLRKCFLLNGTRLVNKLGVGRCLFSLNGKCFFLTLFNFCLVLGGGVCAPCLRVRAHVRLHRFAKFRSGKLRRPRCRWHGDIAALSQCIGELLTQTRQHRINLLCRHARLVQNALHHVGVDVGGLGPRAVHDRSKMPFGRVRVALAHLAVHGVLRQTFVELLRPHGVSGTTAVDVEVGNGKRSRHKGHSLSRGHKGIHRFANNCASPFRRLKHVLKIGARVTASKFSSNAGNQGLRCLN